MLHVRNGAVLETVAIEIIEVLAKHGILINEIETVNKMVMDQLLRNPVTIQNVR